MTWRINGMKGKLYFVPLGKKVKTCP